MKNGIEVSTRLTDSPALARMVAALDVSVNQTIGHVMTFYCAMAKPDRRPVLWLSDAELERLAEWQGENGKFAKAFRAAKYLSKYVRVVKA